MKKPLIDYTEEGIVFCDSLPCSMYNDVNMRCEICPINVEEEPQANETT